jgi:hypothetical protein
MYKSTYFHSFFPSVEVNTEDPERRKEQEAREMP